MSLPESHSVINKYKESDKKNHSYNEIIFYNKLPMELKHLREKLFKIKYKQICNSEIIMLYYY